jgi:hypothetical protein
MLAPPERPRKDPRPGAEHARPRWSLHCCAEAQPLIVSFAFVVFDLPLSLRYTMKT